MRFGAVGLGMVIDVGQSQKEDKSLSVKTFHGYCGESSRSKAIVCFGNFDTSTINDNFHTLGKDSDGDYKVYKMLKPAHMHMP